MPHLADGPYDSNEWVERTRAWCWQRGLTFVLIAFLVDSREAMGKQGGNTWYILTCRRRPRLRTGPLGCGRARPRTAGREDPRSDCGCPKNPPSCTTVMVEASTNAVNYPIGAPRPCLHPPDRLVLTYSHRRLHCPTPFSTWAAHASINSPRRTKKSVRR